MKYKNAASVLPKELINAVQQYVQGEYLYIPIKNKKENDTPTEYELELQKRDAHIFLRSLEGIHNKKLSAMYNLSESSIRRIIINQRKCYETMESRVKKVLSNWKLENQKIVQIYNSAWQVGEGYIIKVYSDVNILKRNIKINTVLDKMNIPVGRIVPANQATTFASDDKYYYVLSEKLRGSNIVHIKNNPDMAYKMGNTIAKLHIAFKECESLGEFWENSLVSELNGWIGDTLCINDWQLVSEDKYNETVTYLEALYDKLPVQLIHRDVHFGNFLFEEGEFSGYIDFDLTQRNIRIFDLCYFTLGLLSEEEKLDIDKQDWFEIVKQVFAGYQKNLKLSEEEKKAVPYVMLGIELLFVAWFIKQSDLKCAENAAKIFNFVNENSDLISHVI